VRNALRAWVLFGGYGGRTRRGVGSLTVIAATQEGAPVAIEQWLPTAATREGLTRLFGEDIFALPVDAREPRAKAKEGGANDMPRLAGAALYIKKAATPKAMDAWLGALGWLREFRQGPEGQPAGAQGASKVHAGVARGAPPVVGGLATSALARHPGKGNRPGISNWPEPDKIRRLSPGPIEAWAHSPERHNAVAAWPRAGFGLPIIGKFQQKDRDLKLWRDRGKREPDDFQILWERGPTKHDRLASPLIVKALPLADGRFVPCALWLERGYPEGGRVYLYQGRGDRPVPRSEAPFERITAPGDVAQFDALKGKSSLRQAFLDWLSSAGKCDTKVAP
jgi:CRISPR-associated protein Cmr1